jgi:hypothetical protein
MHEFMREEIARVRGGLNVIDGHGDESAVAEVSGLRHPPDGICRGVNFNVRLIAVDGVVVNGGRPDLRLPVCDIEQSGRHGRNHVLDRGEVTCRSVVEHGDGDVEDVAVGTS